MATVTAWLVTLSGNLPAAVGAHEFAHVLPDVPARTRVPGTPNFMNEAITWDEEIVTVFDAAGFTGNVADPEVTHYYGIVRYRTAPGALPSFGALKMAGVPVRIQVDDASACELPAALAGWRAFCAACFEHEGSPVPVLDLASLFCGAASGPGNTSGAVRDSSSPAARDPAASVYTDPLAIT